MLTEQKMPSIYAAMVEAGVPISNHYSDLYVPVNDTTIQIVQRYTQASKSDKCVRPSVSVFWSITDNHRQWFDIALAYDPYWEQRMLPPATRGDVAVGDIVRVQDKPGIRFIVMEFDDANSANVVVDALAPKAHLGRFVVNVSLVQHD